MTLNRRAFLAAIGVGATAISGCRRSTSVKQKKTNVVYILADDLGWSDLSIKGGTTLTPHMDAFFEEGLELTNFMACPVCAPTRAGLLTGQHPLRVNSAPRVGGQLDLKEMNLGRALKLNGYRTGIFGKWHNSNAPDIVEVPPGPYIDEYGFEEFVGFPGAAIDYFDRTRMKNKSANWWHNRTKTVEEGYTTDLIRDYSIEYLRENRDRPFFCYVSFSAVHTPIQATPEYLARVPSSITHEQKQVYSAMLIALDDAVGAILSEIDALGLRENTIVVFSSDNGATGLGSNLPFRGGKRTLYEGGIHMPTAIRWPAEGLEGGKKVDGLCGYLDMYPTLMAMMDLDMPPGNALDGKNVWPMIRKGHPSPVDNYYWLWVGFDCLRTPEWKLFRLWDGFELYNLRDDIAEKNNVAHEHPEIVSEMADGMDSWLEANDIIPGHIPVRLDAHPAARPSGDVLEVAATCTGPGTGEPYSIVFATHMEIEERFLVQPYDRLEYDLYVLPESLPDGFFLTTTAKPLPGGHPFLTEVATTVDQLGGRQIEGPRFGPAMGGWARRVIGMGSYSPSMMRYFRLVFLPKRVGRFHFYIDNVIIRRRRDDILVHWADKSDTKLEISHSDNFNDVQVSVVDVSEVR